MARVRGSTAKSDLASAPDRKFVTALGRGLNVLRCFGPRDRWLANQEIAARTGLAKPTVSRLVYTLTQLGFLRHSHSPRKYALGSAAVSLGYSALTQIDIRRAARPLLHALSQQTNASVHLAINDALHMQVVDTYWHSSAFVIDIGSRVPVATTSLVGRSRWWWGAAGRRSSSGRICSGATSARGCWRWWGICGRRCSRSRSRDTGDRHRPQARRAVTAWNGGPARLHCGCPIEVV